MKNIMTSDKMIRPPSDAYTYFYLSLVQTGIDL